MEAAEKLCTCSKAAGEVVPKATLVPLSYSKELEVVEAPVNLTKKLLVPLPDSLLLKVVQSVLVRLPVLTMEALGMDMVRALPEMVAVNKLPLVLVETVVTGVPPKSVEVEVQE